MFCVQWRDTADLQSEMVSLIEGSLQRLDLEYIDILLLHNTNQIPNFEQLTGTCFFKIISKTPIYRGKTPIYRGVLGKGNIRRKSGSAVNRGVLFGLHYVCLV